MTADGQITEQFIFALVSFNNSLDNLFKILKQVI